MNQSDDPHFVDRSEETGPAPSGPPVRPTVSFHPSLTGSVQVQWGDCVDIARDAGFRAIDVVLAEAMDRPPKAVRHALDEAGLRAGPASLPVEFRLDEDRFRRDLSDLPSIAEFAAAVGVRTMFRSLPPSSDLPAGQLLPLLQRRVRACATILRAYGIQFALEVVSPLHRRREAAFEFIWRIADGADFARSCGDGVGVLVDSWHWHHAQATAADITSLEGEILHVHVADAPPVEAEAIRDDQRLLPGQGVVDHATFLGALSSIGYCGLISPEVRGYRCSRAPVDCCRAALDATMACLNSPAR
jgi:sugar phosphate isomerase/epimerase